MTFRYLCGQNGKKMNSEPQFTFEQLYRMPFTKQRDFDHEQLRNVYVPIQQPNLPTGIRALDDTCSELMQGHNPSEDLCQRLGVTAAELSAFVRVLTGMTLVELRHLWMLRLSDDLLRYTSLPLGEVARRAGFATPQHYSRYIKRHQQQRPTLRRRRLRQQGDLGMYRL